MTLFRTMRLAKSCAVSAVRGLDRLSVRKSTPWYVARQTSSSTRVAGLQSLRGGERLVLRVSRLVLYVVQRGCS